MRSRSRWQIYGSDIRSSKQSLKEKTAYNHLDMFAGQGKYPTHCGGVGNSYRFLGLLEGVRKVAHV